MKLAQGSGCAVLFSEESIVKDHDHTAVEDRPIGAANMKPTPSTMLTREQYEQSAAKVRASDAQGVHLFNEGRKEMMKGF